MRQHPTVDWFCGNDQNGVSGNWYEKGINFDELNPHIGVIISELFSFEICIPVIFFTLSSGCQWTNVILFRLVHTACSCSVLIQSLIAIKQVRRVWYDIYVFQAYDLTPTLLCVTPRTRDRRWPLQYYDDVHFIVHAAPRLVVLSWYETQHRFDLVNER